MRAEDLWKKLQQIEDRLKCDFVDVYPNLAESWCGYDGAPSSAFIVWGELGPAEDHECFYYEMEEGCAKAGHSDYRVVAWIDFPGRVHYM